MTMLLEKSWIRMTVVNPSSAFPTIFCTSAILPRISETKNMIAPKTVTTCIGAVEKDEMLLSAYRIKANVDHLDSPASRS